MKITESKLRALIKECITEDMFHIQQSEHGQIMRSMKG